MKKIFLGVAALFVTTGMAAAADMPLKAPMKAPPPVMLPWEGVYIGAEGGYGWSRQAWTQSFTSCAAGPLPPGCLVALDRTGSANEVKGGLAGGLIGFNRQMGSTVFGLEFNWDAADLKGTRAHVLNPTFSSTSQIDWIATFTGRIGFLVTDRVLLFAKGGFAVVDENHRISSAGGALSTRPDGTRKGWVVGAGMEYLFASNFSAKLEYNYMDFRAQTYNFTFANGLPVGGLVENWRVNQQTHLFKVGLNWHFAPLPLVARY
jgi:outer membrane immunogenic protein